MIFMIFINFMIFMNFHKFHDSGLKRVESGTPSVKVDTFLSRLL